MPKLVLGLFTLALVFLTGLLSCNPSKEKEAPLYRIIGEAFAGPNELPIRQDVSLRSPVIGTVKHAEKLEILDRRRRFVQVRTKAQLIGWVDLRLLISAKQMEDLEALARQYKNAPTMGRATVFDILNVHTDPNRYSPTFLQIPEKDHFDLIGHRVVVRAPFQGQSIEIEDDTPDATAIKKKRAKKLSAKIDLPAAPAAPKPPADWLEMSRAKSQPEPEKKKPGSKVHTTAAPVTQLIDDISLIRTRDGRVGWVLTNAIFLDVPDDVAQYAEGNRITAYFPMGEVSDGDKKHHHWLWTTQSQKYAPFEFDGLRVFTYNIRHHRYETSYRERNLRGFFPILVDSAKQEPEFRIVTEDASGKRWLKAYAFDGTRVRSLGKQPYDIPKGVPAVSAGLPLPPKPEPTLIDRIKKMIPGKP